ITLEMDSGLMLDGDGHLRLATPPANPALGWIWIANTLDGDDNGTVSKLDRQKVREVARYMSVTCSSLATGSSLQCDGTNGCCAVDDWARYQARRFKQNVPGHQAVQTSSNYPSRTTLDENGDLYVANAAFAGQSSVTKIAADPSRCP